MSDLLDALECRLIAGYQQQVKHYEKALGLVAEVADEAKEVSVNNNWLPAFQEAVQLAEEVGKGLAADQTAWLKSGRVPCLELHSVLERRAQHLRALSENVNRHIATLLARKEQLLPQIDGFIQQRRMLNAYSQYGQST